MSLHCQMMTAMRNSGCTQIQGIYGTWTQEKIARGSALSKKYYQISKIITDRLWKRVATPQLRSKMRKKWNDVNKDSLHSIQCCHQCCFQTQIMCFWWTQFVTAVHSHVRKDEMLSSIYHPHLEPSGLCSTFLGKVFRFNRELQRKLRRLLDGVIRQFSSELFDTYMTESAEHQRRQDVSVASHKRGDTNHIATNSLQRDAIITFLERIA